MKKRVVCMGVMALVAAKAVFAIELTSPIKGETVQLIPDEQRKVLALPTLQERLDLFAWDRKENGKKIRHADAWRKAKPLKLRWKRGPGEKGPWEIRIGTKPDLSDARVEVYADRDSCMRTNFDGSVRCALPLANLEIGRRYYWRVTSNAGCAKWGHARGKCPCKRQDEKASEIATFVTEDLAPRWIAIEGKTQNIRDLGGRKGMNGCRVRQGLVYRGQGLNNNSVNGERPGRNRLTVEDVKLLTETFGIKTDLDLRSEGETAGMTVSPLGEKVKFIHRSSEAYRGIFTDHGKAVMAANFRDFCDRANYPIYFHCIGGADRTGALGYVLNAVLGVDRHELETDWESTFYPSIPDANPNKDHWCRESHFNDGFSKYGKEGDSWNRRVELYLLDCGVKPEEIETFRKIMLEPAN